MGYSYMYCYVIIVKGFVPDIKYNYMLPDTCYEAGLFGRVKAGLEKNNA